MVLEIREVDMAQLRLVVASLVALAALLPSDAGNAQTYPSRPIRWIVPYTPGGLTDNVTRMVAAKLQEALGQPIAIENKPGANSITGAEAAATATPDGYTFLTVIAAFAANDTLYAGKLPYDTRKSFFPVSLVGIAPLILTASNTFEPKTASDLIAYAKAHPGRIGYGSSGVGSAAHLTSELLRQTSGTDMLHVPYKGTAPALQALMGGEIQMLIDVPSSLMGPVRGGKIKALAMFSASRLPSAPDVPTIEEAGGPKIEAATWVLFLAPTKTPVDIIARIARETGKIVGSADIKTRFEAQGIEPVGGTPAEAARFLDAEVEKWGRVIKTANVKPE
jgi:tripartite-type tricarboxylate transporter receptor subunit TctC